MNTSVFFSSRKIKSQALLLAMAVASPFMLGATCTYAAPLSVNEYEIGNILKWATANEQDNDLFVIERSLDGINFESIGQVKGEEYSKEYKEYQFLDLGLGNQKSFYRLIQVDRNGATRPSHILKVDREEMNNFSVYNMNTTDVKKDFIVTLESSVIGVLEYEVYSERGQTVSKGTKILGQFIDQVKINMSQYPKGIYKIVLKLGEEQETLVVRRSSQGFQDGNKHHLKMNE